MILVDTGYFLAVANPRDHLFDRAIAWTKALTEQLVVTEAVFVESMNAFSRREFRHHSIDLADAVFSIDRFVFVRSNNDMLTRSIEMHRLHADKELSLTDCNSFHVMKSRGITAALSHDHHFEQAGFEALLRRDPD